MHTHNSLTAKFVQLNSPADWSSAEQKGNLPEHNVGDSGDRKDWIRTLNESLSTRPIENCVGGVTVRPVLMVPCRIRRGEY
jgi:hypothetical protein